MCDSHTRRHVWLTYKMLCVTHIRDVSCDSRDVICDSHTRCHEWLTYEMSCVTHIWDVRCDSRDVMCDSHTRCHVWLILDVMCDSHTRCYVWLTYEMSGVTHEMSCVTHIVRKCTLSNFLIYPMPNESIVTTLLGGRFEVRVSTGVKYLSFSQNVQTGWGPHPLSCLMATGVVFQG
jgi:hypothetical protein